MGRKREVESKREKKKYLFPVVESGNDKLTSSERDSVCERVNLEDRFYSFHAWMIPAPSLTWSACSSWPYVQCW